MTSQWRHKMGYRLFTWVKELMCGSVIYTYNNRIFVALNVYRNTKMKIWLNKDFNFTWNWRRFDVSVQEKYIAYINTILEICVYLATKIRC